MLYRTLDAAIDWWTLEMDEYRKLEQDAEGIIRSRVFPGLWLDVPGLIAGDIPRFTACLERGMQSHEYLQFSERLRSQIEKISKG